MPTLTAIREALADRPARTDPPGPGLAAVAMTFAGPPDALHLCLIRRATREGDRWSGQMAFPGGKAEPQDATPIAAAIREAREEVDLELADAEVLGRLAKIPLSPTGAKGVLAPFAFYIGTERPPLRPNEGEVADAFWLPLPHLWDEANRDTIDWPWQGNTLRFPGIRVRGGIVWGLTYRVLRHWAELLGQPLPGHGDPPFERVG